MTAPTLVRVLWRDIRSEYYDPRLQGNALEDLVVIVDPQVKEAVDAASGYDRLAEWALGQMTAANAAGAYDSDDAGDTSGANRQHDAPGEEVPLNQVVIENFVTGAVFRLKLTLRGDELTCKWVGS